MTTVAQPAARRGLPITGLIFFAILSTIIIMIVAGRNPWNEVFINPLINVLLMINIITFGQFGLTIILFTLLLRVATLPFTIRQLQSTKAMQSIQPRMAEMQKKYKDPKRRQEEMMKLYKEAGINPLGCFGPMLIQIVVFMGLYRALVYTVGGSPESLVGLSHRLYPLGLLQNQIPLNQHFLWLSLGHPDPTFLVPLLVGASTYTQQRLSITPGASAQQQQQQQMMTWMLPLMLMFFTLNLPSGVGVYWVVTNIFSLFASYWVYGRRILSWKQLLPIPIDAPAPAARPKSQDDDDMKSEEVDDQPDDDGSNGSGGSGEARSQYGKRRGKRKKRR
ncbi:MAG: YidC/Oxa1 family membrane protein insertase [Chloroflexota bacterium]